MPKSSNCGRKDYFATGLKLIIVPNLISALVKKGAIDKEKALVLQEEIKKSKLKEEEVILKKGIVSEDVLFNLKSEELQIPFKKSFPEDISLDVLKLIPEEAANFYKIIPLGKKGDIADIGMVYPEDLESREALKFLTRQQKISYNVFLISLSNFAELFKKYRTLREEVAKALKEIEVAGGEKVKNLKPSAFEVLTEEAPIAKMVAVILRHAVEGEASDVHIEPVRNQIRVRFRLDGVLYPSLFLPLKVLPAIVSRIKILSDLKIDETRLPQDGRFRIEFDKNEIDFRVSTFPTIQGEKVTMRILDPKKGLREIEDAGISGRNLEVVMRALNKPFGLILVTGPTGSGKSTTLYTFLTYLNKEQTNIVTVEDPVEYFIDGLSQSQVKPEIGYDFPSALRQIVRQDPDIIMVGEIRDEETASLAVHASLTGHLVLSTLHANNAIGVIPRLVDMGVKPFLIPASLSLAIGQRLVRKLCSDCKKKIKATKEHEKIIFEGLKNLPDSVKESAIGSNPLYIWKAQGCKSCNDQGYKGRLAIFEMLEMTSQLESIILEGLSERKLQDEAARQGMMTMRQDGFLKALKGLTSIEEIVRETDEKKSNIVESF